jgi:hypothetical protein
MYCCETNLLFTCLGYQILVKPSNYLFPSIHCGVLSVAWAVDSEETVPGVGVHVELVGLAVTFEGFLHPSYPRGRWSLIFFAKKP